MPRVPYRSQVSLNRLDTPESAPVKTGLAEMGRGIARLGEGISSLEKQHAAEQDDAFLAELKRQYNETYQKSEIEVKGSPRFRGNKVNTDEGAPEKFLQENLGKKRQELDALAAKNPRVAKVFKVYADDVDSKGRIFSADWTSAQTFKATADNHDALVSAATEDLASATPQDVEVRVSDLIAAVDSRSNFLGHAKAVADQQALAATSSAFQIAIDRQVAMNTKAGYEAAKVIFENAKKNNYLSAKVVQQREDQMRQLGDHWYADDVSTAFFQQVIAKNGGVMNGSYNTWEQDKAKVLEKYNDQPALKAKVEASLNAKYNSNVAQDAERFTTMARTMVSNYDQTGSWSPSDLSVLNNFPIELREKILDWSQRVDRPTNPEVSTAIFTSFDAAVKAGDPKAVTNAISMIYGNMNQLSNQDRKMLEKKADDAMAAVAGKPTSRAQAWDRIKNKIEVIAPKDIENKQKMAVYENYFYGKVYDFYTGGGKKELSDQDLNKMVGDIIRSSNQTVATTAGWFNKERGTPISEAEMFEITSGLRQVPSGVVPGVEFIDWANQSDEAFKANALRVVAFAKGADARRQEDRVRMEAALNALGHSVPFTQWKQDWEQANGRPLTNEAAAAAYSSIARQAVLDKKAQAQREQKSSPIMQSRSAIWRP